MGRVHTCKAWIAFTPAKHGSRSHLQSMGRVHTCEVIKGRGRTCKVRARSHLQSNYGSRSHMQSTGCVHTCKARAAFTPAKHGSRSLLQSMDRVHTCKAWVALTPAKHGSRSHLQSMGCIPTCKAWVIVPTKNKNPACVVTIVKIKKLWTLFEYASQFLEVLARFFSEECYGRHFS